MAIKFNVEPYYDDFETATAVDGLSPKEKYYKVLFRPGHAVQGRELTQLQSILQNQVTQFGKHFFEEGSMVIPGHSTLESKLDYVKVTTNAGAATLTSLVGLTFTGATTGLTAKVVAVAAADGTDLNTLYVRYQRSGTSQEKVFDDGETITAPSAYSGVVATSGTGFGSVAFIAEGVYFIEGHFVVVQEQQLILDKYDTNPSYDIGLQVVESVQTSAGDVTLNDNANGTPNYAAPGAHRYQIKTTLVKQAVGATGIEKFLLLIRCEEGRITKSVRTTDYSVLEETLARRTFDESGNYTVRPFLATVREHAAVNTPGDDTKLAIGLEPGKAYIRGYEIESLATKYLSVDKARETTLFEAASVPVTIGNYVNVNGVSGIPDINTFDNIELRDTTAAVIGYARARSYVFAGAGAYRVYLFDIRMNATKLFQDVRTVYQSGTPPFEATVILNNSLAVIQEPNRNSMVFPLPFTRVSTCDSSAANEADDFNYVYFLNRDIGSSVVAAGAVTFATVGSSEQLEPFDDENWIMTLASGGNAGDIVTLTSGQVAVASGSGSVIINGLSAHEGVTVRLIAGVKRTLEHKMKSLTTSGAANVDLWPVTSPSAEMILGHADGYKLRAVYMSANLSTGALITDTDVTEYYDFDDGQRDNFYDLARVVLKSNTAFVPTGRLLIKYEYFTSTGSGDFFSVDSYANLTDSLGAAVGYADIPYFISKNLGQKIELRSAIDFRPRVSNSGGNFSGTGSAVSVCPEPLTTFTTDVQYYLNRIDKIYMDKEGTFGVTKGVPALYPELPEDPKDSMVLYNVMIPAYTLNPAEVGIQLIDNKRYTMRDIGRLDKRINSLEYYTSLSMLEKEAQSKQVVDAGTQVQRLKSGFLVDSFSSHNVGNVLDQEYKAAIDRDNRQLRPLFASDNVRLMYNSGLSSNVQKTGDLITLPYTESVFYYQSQASSAINVNPFDVFTWQGTVEISPSSDEWKDTTRRPDVTVDQEGVYDAMLGIINETNALGTVWNEWQQSWTGQSTSTSTSRNVSRRRGWFGSQPGVETTTTTVTPIGQTRSGIETAVVPDTITTNIGDRVVEINFAPYIRSRIVTFKATRLKPNTQMYAFFDNVSVANFVRTESTFIKYTELDNPQLNGTNTFTAHPASPSTLTTDANGTLIGSFFVPNNPTTFFKTGSRLFKLTDSSSNSNTLATTEAATTYNAKGLIETKENVTISTRVPLIERREVADDRVITDTRQNTSVNWFDPLAQSFMLDTPGGAFITSIELFFHKKATGVPVTLQIREMNQGLPTQRIIPFGEVTINPAAVSAADLSVSLPDSTLPTKFTFPSPVYLQDNQEYCFVVMANTNEYEVWYAEIGEDNAESGERISKQPYAGVLFKSQNASTWTPDQNKDLKFRINRATFSTGVNGQLILENGSVQSRKLIKNAFRTTSGSDTIRVYHNNHHFFENTNSIASYVTISGAVNVNGFTAAQLNATHEVGNIELDSYTITISGTNATGTGIGGGTSISATENQLYNTFYPYVQQLNFPGTNSTWGVRTTTGMSLGATSPTPYVTSGSFAPIIVNQNTGVTSAGVIASDDNEQSGKSFYLRGAMTTTADNISPVIDLERCSVVTISNRIDNPIGSDTIGYNTVDGFVAETAATGGSAQAKYLTKIVKLAEAADGIRLYIDVNRPSQTAVDVYYKSSSSDEAITSELWILATPEENIPYDDSGLHTEIEYVIDPPGTFTVFQIKIVMRSTNSSRIPTIKDLRAIALLP